MKRWPAPTISQRLQSLPVWAIAIPCALVLLGTAWYATYSPRIEEPEAGVALNPSQQESTAMDRPATTRAADIPASVLTVSLYDELFPQAPPAETPPSPPPPPVLDVVLVAITSGLQSAQNSDDRLAFLRAPATNEYLSLAVGQRTPGGAEILEIDEGGVLFALGGRKTRLELEP